LKKITIIIFLFFYQNLYSYEIIRDQVFENYLKELSDIFFKKADINFYLIDDDNENAFVLDNKSIFFTKGLLEHLENENALISIMLHEYGHIKKNHIIKKKLKIKESEKYKKYTDFFSIAAAITMQDPDILFGANITLNEGILQNFYRNNVEIEKEADFIMIQLMNKNNLSIKSTLSFFHYLQNLNLENPYKKTHPSISERINFIMKNYKGGKKKYKSTKFDFLKAKYHQNSNNKKYNNFFKQINSGKYLNLNNDKMTMASKYELFKKGFKMENIIEIYMDNIKTYDNSYTKLEFLNYLIENSEKYKLSENLQKYKLDKKVKEEFFFHFILGKSYDYLNEVEISNFYFCNFYKKIHNQNLSDYYCDKYDTNKIEIVDLINEVNVNIN
tara:strand:+ start:558 stop:1718 length:1161 start_codon:yes stop_codon:yes gene_type:complete